MVSRQPPIDAAAGSSAVVVTAEERKNAAMKMCDLFIASADSVPTRDYVTTVLIPRFVEPPAVLLWGDRVFQLVGRMSPLAGDAWAYIEAFAVVALKEDTDAPQRLERLKAVR